MTFFFFSLIFLYSTCILNGGTSWKQSQKKEHRSDNCNHNMSALSLAGSGDYNCVDGSMSTAKNVQVQQPPGGFRFQFFSL